jgi:hypothetical protein
VSTLFGHRDSVCASLGPSHNEAVCKIVSRVCHADSWK